MIYIVNFKTDDEEKRIKRDKIHHRQLEWYLEFTDYDINIVAMNYRISDYIKNPRIKYFTHEGRIMANEARTIYFKDMFYNQDTPWAIFADDDCYFYSEDWERHCDGRTFIRDIAKTENLSKFKEIDIIWPMDPVHHGYFHKKEIELYKNNWVFKRHHNVGHAFCIVKKRDDIAWWTETKELYPGDEMMFCYDNWLRGITSYYTGNIAKKHEDCWNRSWVSQFSDEITDVTPADKNLSHVGLNFSNKNLLERYKEYGYSFGGKKGLTKQPGKILDYVNRATKNIIIPKNEELYVSKLFEL